ncbi:MAG: lipocalin family protein [Rhizobacter sp.]|nr:lipocalin family protein [Bacteriovorax sp.]
MNLLKTSLPLLCGFLISACSHTAPYTKTVSKVDLPRFMKPWHVQAGRFTSFEKNPYNSVESYTWNEKEKRIDIDFSYNEGAFDGPVKKMPQKGWVKDTVTNSTWSVQPWWPLKFDYLIIGLGDNYEWTAIGVPDQKYLWIMTGEAQFSHEKVQEILAKLHESGYNTEDIKWVQHNKK